MGMKSNSYHFDGTNGKISYDKMRQGKLKFKLDIQLFAKLPKDISQLNHMFRKDIGHLPDTLENRKSIIELTEDPNNFVGKGLHNTSWYSKITPSGQLRASVRNGIVQNCGLNRDYKKYIKGVGIKGQKYYKRKVK